MDNFVVENLGPIAKAEVDFGDLTILTGPQASGKTLFLETFKLIVDTQSIAADYLMVNGSLMLDSFLDYFYGDHMHSIIQDNTKTSLNGSTIHINDRINESASSIEEKIQELKRITTVNSTLVFTAVMDSLLPKVKYIPAQRSSVVSEGRIMLSKDFVNSPYVFIKFSDYLQQYVKLKPTEILKDTIKDYEFLKDAEINIRRSAGSPRLVMSIDDTTIPYMAWSTGQRELTALLMALENTDKGYVIVEEPEFGLHPRAIIEFMFTVLKLMKSGVKVVISTHSSTPLDFVWAMNHLKESNADIANIAEMFDFKIKDKSVFDGLAEKVIKVYYFSPDKKTRKVYSKDISSLDVYSEDEDVSNWGGMSLSADRAGSIVSKF